MPSINNAVEAAAGLSGYTPVESPPERYPPSVTTDYAPMRNSMIRCPIPTLWNDSSDSQRQFYINGQVPQVRIMAPPQGSTTGGSSGGNAEVTQGGSGTSGGGGSSSGGGSTNPIQAVQASFQTSLLVPGAVFTGTIQLSQSFQLLSVSTTSASRVQMYATRIAQMQDASRGLDDAPPAGIMQNLLSDVALDTAPYRWSFQNRVAANADTPQTNMVYVTVTNLDVLSDVVTVTLLYVPLETGSQ